MNTQPISAISYLTPQDLEKRFNISLSTQALMRMKKRQENDHNPLPFIKIGRKIFYIENQIEAWMLAKQAENSPCYTTEYVKKLYKNIPSKDI